MKLLEKTVKTYLIYSAVLILIIIPVSYFIIQALCLQDVDEALQDRRKELVAQINQHPALLINLPWQNINREIEIFPPVANTSGREEKKTIPDYRTMSGNVEPYRELHSFVTIKGTTYPVVLRISLINIEDLIQGIVISVALLMVTMLGGLLWINRRQSQRLWLPFYQVLSDLQRFKIDKPSGLAFSPTNIREFEDLQKAILELTVRAKSTFSQQKEFTENASHELQTPLAALQAKVELLLQEEDLNPHQAEVIGAMNEAIQRISRINKGLLLLAKIENDQFSETAHIRLAPAIDRILAPLDFLLKLKSLSLHKSLQETSIKSNPDLVDMLLSNLIINALRHASENSTINIMLRESTLQVSNSGEPLTFPEAYLFSRFQKGKEKSHSSGTGLGLAIVKQICDTCHFKIDYQYASSLHIFTVRFPS